MPNASQPTSKWFLFRRLPHRDRQTVIELSAVVGERLRDLHQHHFVQSFQIADAAGLAPVGIYTPEHLARGPVDGHEQVAGGRLVEHLRYGLDVNVNAALVSQGPRKPSGGPFVIEIPMAWIEDC